MEDAEYTFLLVEREARDALLLVRYLAEEQEDLALAVDQAATAADARARLEAKEYDLVLVGSLDEPPLSLLGEICAKASPPPVILLTDRPDPGLAAAAREAGATDFLVKSGLRR